MDKIYMILQRDNIDEDKLMYENGYFVYYASDDLNDIVDKIKNNWTDLHETVCPYIILKTITLNSVAATHEPLRIFEFQRETETYKEIAYLKTGWSEDGDEFIKYLEEEN